MRAPRFISLPILGAALLAAMLFGPLSDSAYAGTNVQSPGKFGIGVVVGYPHEGLSMNWFVTGSTSLQVDVAIWLSEHWNTIGGRVDFLFWMPKIAGWSWADLVWYWGPGGNVFSWSWDGPEKADPKDGYIGLGAELPVGIGFQFKKVNIDANIEAVPVFHILGSDGIDFDLGIAGVANARYYF